MKLKFTLRPALLSLSLLLLPSLLIGEMNERYLKANDSLKNFVSDVVYKVEEGDRSSKSRRWTKRPNIVVHGSDAHKQKVTAVFNEIYGVALGDGAPQGEINIHIGDRSELRKLAKDTYKINFDGSWQYWTWWTGASEIYRAVVLIDPDEAEDFDRLLNIACLRSLGLPSSSKKNFDSLLSSKFESLTEVTDFDRYFVTFYYTHIPPGTTRTDLRRIVKAQWGKE